MFKTQRYSKVAVILHWLIAIGIFSMLAFGWYMAELPKDAPKQIAFDLFDFGIYTLQLSEAVSPRTFYFGLHKSIGITLLALIIVRFLWRLTHKPPAMLTSYQPFERKLATGVHHLLYLMMFAVPLTGLIMAAASKYGAKWFDVTIIPGFDNEMVRDIFHEAHEIAGVLIVAILALHIAGALKHQFIDKDETMKRMSI